MGALNLIPLVVLFAVVGGLGWVGYQVFTYLSNRPRKQVANTHAFPDLPLLQRACRARRQEDGEEERRLYQRRRKSRSQGSQRRKIHR